jgi:hypothetical protein
MPILIPLVSAQRCADSLTESESLILARWAYKTAFMVLSGQSELEVPWQLFNTWFKNGSQEPDPAIIFALTESTLPKAFYYCVDTDHFTSTETGPFNIRVGICINALILIALIPTDDLLRHPGATNLSAAGVNYKLLWPQDQDVVPIPFVPVDNAPIGYSQWIKFMVAQVNAGVRGNRKPDCSVLEIPDSGK